MRKRTTRQAATAASQATELAIAVPQVVAHRLTRMALAGGTPSARDQREFARMGTEKLEAFSESWAAMAMNTVAANQKLAMQFMWSFWFPWLVARPTLNSAAFQLGSAAMGTFQKGMTPVRRRATANARRLGKT